jgi:hypothetical protein
MIDKFLQKVFLSLALQVFGHFFQLVGPLVYNIFFTSSSR